MGRLKMLLGAGVCVVALSACHGTPETTTVTAEFTCTSGQNTQPPWTRDFTFSLDTPTWATTGSTISLANLQVTVPSNSVLNEVYVDPQGLASFTQPDAPAERSQPNAFFDTGPGHTFPTVNTPLTGAVGEYATIDVTGIMSAGIVGPKAATMFCAPTDGTPLRIASIRIDPPISN